MSRRLAALAAVLVVVGTGACGSDQPAGTAGAAVPGAPGATTSPGTGAAEPSLAAGRSPEQALEAVAATTAEQRSARFTFSGDAPGDPTGAPGRPPGGTVDGRGSFRVDGAGVAMSLQMRVPGEESGTRLIEGRIVGDALYFKLPPEDSPAGKPWLEISPDDATPLAEGLRPLFEQLERAADPAANVALLRAATTVEAAGTETVDGVRTTRYDATVDLAEAATVARLYRTLVDSGVDTLEYSVWVDGEDLPRRFATTVDTPQGRLTSGGTFSDWGEPVDVQAPPATQTTSFAELS